LMDDDPLQLLHRRAQSIISSHSKETSNSFVNANVNEGEPLRRMESKCRVPTYIFMMR
jgi:hypothetical protein